MSLYLKLAIRNIFRNKRRTIIAGVAIGIGLAALIFVDALVIGMERNLIDSATGSFMGEAQIHREGYRETYDVELTINRADSIVADLNTNPQVEAFTTRVMSYAMITSPSGLSSVTLVGVNPKTETQLSKIDEAIQSGSFFEANGERNILVGNDLAEILDAELGDRVVLTVSQAGTGDLSQEMFRISGIFHFNIKEMDRSMVFVRQRKAQEMLGLENGIHEIALTFTNRNLSRNEDLSFWDEYSSHGNEALSWTELMPELKTALQISSFSTLITGIILFAVVALGIINTLFMSLHERMFEFGVLRAIGTRPFAMGRLIVLEAGALAVLASLIGIVLGFAITALLGKIGIDYTGIEFSGVTFTQLLYPVLEIDQFIIYPLAVYIFTILSSLYPAVYAARLSPADAMRRSV